MSDVKREFGAYGFVNGLGLHGDDRSKEKLLKRLLRAIDRGDWEKVAEYLLAYGAGRTFGSLALSVVAPNPGRSNGDVRW